LDIPALEGDNLKSLSKFADRRINNRLPVAWEGLPFIGIGIVLTLLCYYSGFLFVAIFFGILTVFTIYFFRDPNRPIQGDDKTVLTPADGRIIDIQYLDDGQNPLGESAIKVSVFMSIFNVHVNRVPIKGRISKIDYHSGKFLSANLDKASEQNENNRVTLQTDQGHKIVFVQIAGLVARRIVCWIKAGDRVGSGQRCGLIRFGSRLDVYLPKSTRLHGKMHQKVKAGETKLGYLT
jgi:phosphatidylserine decarboxylase